MTYVDKLRRQARRYCRNLDNYKTVLKDTNNRAYEVLAGEYNCMGYALGIFDWLDCDTFRYILEDCEMNNRSFDPADPTNEEMELLNEMAADVAFEVRERFNLRVIDRPAEARSTERVIAMRCSFGDFHFARLNSDGLWTHKPGGNDIRIMTEKELYSWGWCKHRYDPYISDIHFFAVDASIDLEDEYCEE